MGTRSHLLIAVICAVGLATESGCTDWNPAGGDTTIPSPIPYVFTNRDTYGLLEQLTGLATDSVWGIVSLKFVTGQDSFDVQDDAQLGGWFSCDGRGPFREIACNGLVLNRDMPIHYEGFSPLVRWLSYSRTVPRSGSRVDFEKPVAWRIVAPDSEIVADTVFAPPSFGTVTIVPNRDTVQAHRPLELTWENGTPRAIVIVHVDWWPDTVTSADHWQSPTYVFLDNGGCTIPVDSLSAAGLPSHGALIITLVRGTYTNTTRFDHGTKRLGTLSYVETRKWATLVP